MVLEWKVHIVWMTSSNKRKFYRNDLSGDLVNAELFK